MNDIIFLSPDFKERIWGGNKLNKDWGYSVTGQNIGECWAVSAHENGCSTVVGGKYADMRLDELFMKHPELFGYDDNKQFPLLVKIIDAKENLSIQVHPGDEYALNHENGAKGKAECWYVLDAPDDAKLIIGHNASSKEELSDMIHQGQWNKLIRQVPVKKGDFVMIEPGTVHSIMGGLLILEIQQNSDITYRVYDYDRVCNGSKRELHIDKSIDVITAPSPIKEDAICNYEILPENELVLLTDCKSFKVWKSNIEGSFSLNMKNRFMLASVIEGEGTVCIPNSETEEYRIKKGSHFIIPNGVKEVSFTGKMQVVFSTVSE